MKIIVDADACPVKEIILKVSRERKLPVVMFFDNAHIYSDGYSEVVILDRGADSVDFAIIGRLSKEDVVVTQDFGLAAMVIGKGAKAINQNGLVFNNENIDRLLFERHLGKKVRREGGRTKLHKKRSETDNEKFETAFVHLLDNLS